MPQIRLCPTCERRNLAAQAECEFCGTQLSNAASFDVPDLTPPKISVKDTAFKLPLQVEFVIGRADEKSDWLPDIDLLPFGGTSAAGVSRRHARLVWYGHWQIEDLNSANGTLLDRRRVEPGKPQDLIPGAIIQIGKLYLVFHG